jgi:hypothetical protein
MKEDSLQEKEKTRPHQKELQGTVTRDRGRDGTRTKLPTNQKTRRRNQVPLDKKISSASNYPASGPSGVNSSENIRLLLRGSL